MKENSFILVVLLLSVGVVIGLTLWNDHGGQDDMWSPNDMYSKHDVMSRASSTFTSASYSSGMINDGVALTIRHRSFGSTRAHVPSYAHAYGTPMTSGQGSVASSGGIYTTSSSEFRSFGGGGMSAGVSMSSGSRSVASNGPIAQSGGVYTSMPTGVLSSSLSATNNMQMPISGNEMMAMNNPANDFSSASASAYSGWGKTTALYGTATYGGNGSNRISGRRNAGPTDNGRGTYEMWLEWMMLHGWRYGTNTGGNDYTFTTDQAYQAFLSWYKSTYGKDYDGNSSQFDYETWVEWYMNNNGSHTTERGYHFTFFQSPIGDIIPLVVFVLAYMLFVMVRRYRHLSKQVNELTK